MASTRLLAERRVRKLLKDENYSDLAIPRPLLHQAMEQVMRTLASRYRASQAWVAGAATLTVGNSDATLASSVEYAQIISLVRASDKYPLDRWSEERMASARSGSSTLTQGQPYAVWFWEDQTQTVNARFYPAADGSYSFDLLRSVIPAALATDSTSIPFDLDLVDALVLETAATLLPAMTAARRDALGLDPALADVLRSQAASLGQESMRKRASFGHTGHIARIEA